jgi:hypothetical protein
MVIIGIIIDGRGKLKIMWKSLFLNAFSPYLSYTKSQLSFELASSIVTVGEEPLLLPQYSEKYECLVQKSDKDVVTIAFNT